MFRFLKEYFNLSNNEQRGIISLMLIILFAFGGTRLYLQLKPTVVTIKDNTELIALLNQNESDAVKTGITKKESILPEARYFKFDPNLASKEDLLSLGFKENVANTLINFRSKGGKFYQKEDLKKVYGLNANFYAKIEDYIQIKSKSYPKEKSKSSNSTTYTPSSPTVAKKVAVNINTSDSAALTSVKGIGPAFSSRIIKYRNLLGGFTAKEQLLEVYGITPEVYDAVKDQLILSGSLKFINVNNTTWVELKNHPYISSELANILLNYKKAHGRVVNFNFLIENKLISQEKFDKLIPYLSLE
jgi:DNA uptake protein ComE-like DNA-binding protein